MLGVIGVLSGLIRVLLGIGFRIGSFFGDDNVGGFIGFAFEFLGRSFIPIMSRFTSSGSVVLRPVSELYILSYFMASLVNSSREQSPFSISLNFILSSATPSIKRVEETSSLTVLFFP